MDEFLIRMVFEILKMLNTAFDWFLLMKQDLKRYADLSWFHWYGMVDFEICATDFHKVNHTQLIHTFLNLQRCKSDFVFVRY